MKTENQFLLRQMPLIFAIVALIFWIVERQLYQGASSYAIQNFGHELIVGQILGTSALSTLRFILVGLLIDLLGGRRSLVLFFLLSFIFSTLWVYQDSSVEYGLGNQFFAIAEVFFIIGLYKFIAIYATEKTFLISIAVLLCLNTLLMSYLPHILHHGSSHETFELLGIGVAVVGLIFAACAQFILPKQKAENSLYPMANFSEIISPLRKPRTWCIIVALSIMLLYLGDFFGFLVGGYFGPVLHISSASASGALAAFTVAAAIGYVIYAIIFRDSTQKNRVIALSNILIIVCMLGIGYFSMSEVLIWALVVLTGLFFGSSVLLFGALLKESKVIGFATVCGIVLVVGVILKLFFIRFLLAPTISAHGGQHGLEAMWMIGALLLIVPAVLSFISVKNDSEKKDEKIYPHPTIKARLMSFWRGEFSLQTTFWQLFVLGQGFILFTVCWMLMVVTLPVIMPTFVAGGHFQAPSFQYYFLASVISIAAAANLICTSFSFIAIWRSAKKSSSRFWKSIARVVVIFSVVGAVAYCLICVTAFVHVSL